MARPVTLFTGQWADLPLEDMCRKASDFGYQGLELACWGDHFEVNKAAADRSYSSGRRGVRSDRPAAPRDPAAARVG
jgi:sugar phosphate isomerase/epimerase